MKKISLLITTIIVTIQSFGQMQLNVWDKSKKAAQTMSELQTSKLPKSFESIVPNGDKEIYDRVEFKPFNVVQSDGTKFTHNPIVYRSRKGYGAIVYTKSGWIGHYNDGKLPYSMSPNEVSLDTLLPKEFNCGTLINNDIKPTGDTKARPPIGQAFETRADFYNKNLPINKIATVYFELDYDIWLSRQGQTTNWFTGLFANIIEVYRKEGITMQLTDLGIWTTPSGYPRTSSLSVLNELKNRAQTSRLLVPNTTAFFRQVLTVTGNGLGGLADLKNQGDGYTLKTPFIISGGNYGMSDIRSEELLTNYQDGVFRIDNQYQWPINVISHELGHNFSSPHTQDCIWINENGVLIQNIDSCLGSCGRPTKPSPIPTIMSYCHLNSSNSAVKNLNSNGFGKLPRFALRNFLYNLVNIPFTSAVIPTLSSTTSSSITSSSFNVSSNITNDGGAFIQERGFCYGTQPNPQRNINTTIQLGTGSGPFNTTITGLNSNTTYYVRAYGVNQAGEAYSAQSTVTTSPPVVPTISTVAQSNLSNTTVTSGGTIVSNGGSNILEKGVVWSTSPNPTVSLTTKTNNGTGNTNFTSNVTGLSPSTTYYLRSYATNSVGTGYGNQIIFTTLSQSVIIINQTPIAPSYTRGFTGGGTITSDGGSVITSRGICWNTTGTPTISNSRTTNGNGTGTFTSVVEGLTPNTTYYVRAYATNVNGTNYSSELTYTTPNIPSAILSQNLSVNTLSNFAIPISWTSTTSNGIWSINAEIRKTSNFSGFPTESNPNRVLAIVGSNSNVKLSSGNSTVQWGNRTGAGFPPQEIIDLEPNTTYYVRATMISSTSTGFDNYYSNIISFTTPSAPIPTVKTLSNGGEITSTNVDISERGWVYSKTNTIPTINDQKLVYTTPFASIPNPFVINFGSDRSLFTPPGPVTGFYQDPGRYYVRAYARSVYGDFGYGSVIPLDIKDYKLPVITVLPVTNLTPTTATLNFSYTVDPNSTFSTTPYEIRVEGGDALCSSSYFSGSCISPLIGTGVSNTPLSGNISVNTILSTGESLKPGTLYYYQIRWAISGISYDYPTIYSFTTPNTNNTPNVTGVTLTNVTFNSVTLGSTVSLGGGSTVSSRGFVYSTSQNPTLSNNRIDVGSGLGDFSTTISAGLTPSTTYYVRSFAINSQGTSYSSQSVFTTPSGTTIPAIDPSQLVLGPTLVSRTGNSITISGTVINTGGLTTTRYFCISTQGSTTGCPNQINMGTGFGTFTHTITGLTPGDVRIVRILATNSQGSSQSNWGEFITLSVPVVTTSTVTNIKSTSANAGGTLIQSNQLGSSASEFGVCYGTTPNPTTGGLIVRAIGSPPSNQQPFNFELNGLLPGTLYYVRAYCTNTTGIGYGNQVTFTTTGQGSLPTLTTTALSSITSITAISGGNITSDGGQTVTDRGVVWSTSASPTISLSTKVSAGQGIGSFSSTLTNLTPGVLYYVRAYATNATGTAYGNQLTFTTLSTTPTVTITATATNISQTSATSGGTIGSDGGATISTRGAVWSTSQTPTIALSTKTNDGSGIGTFTSDITGLTAGQVYFVRAYATNTNGTSYGPQITFTTTSAVTLPSVSTTTSSGITTTSATSGGNVSATGGATVTSRGVVWSTSPNPTVSLSTKTNDGSGPGVFTSSISGLTPSTLYYYRAYATNSAGTAYGSEFTFTTSSNLPTVTTTSATAIGTTTATSGGNVTSSGGATVTQRGVVWSTSQNPVVTLPTKTTDGTGTGVFTSTITGLEPGTLYYYRSYATNSVGTSYGTQLSFTTLGISLPTVTTAIPSSVTVNSAVSGGNVTSDGNSPVTQRGVCWSTSQNPTISNQLTVNGSGTGSFVSNITNLQPNTTYYIRAYATNSLGTSYGNQVTLLTSTQSLPVIEPTGLDNITFSSVDIKYSIISTGGSDLLERGVCYSTSPNPTTSNQKIQEICSNEVDCSVGEYTSSISGLSPNTTYYIRSYAINGVGTGYGSESVFTTNIGPADVITLAITNITSISATSGGSITVTGGGTIIQKGVCWSNNPLPTINNSITTDGGGIGLYNSNIQGLNPGVTYYVRAYCTNQVGTFYGNELSFTTSNISLPTLTTNSVTSITTTSAISGGNITDNGGSSVTVRGVVWSTSQNPTISLTTKTSDGSGNGSFSSTLSGLSPGITYYVRAYATNSAGTSYGQQNVFTTTGSIPSVSTTSISGITQTSATSGGNVTSSGGSNVTARGIIWSTSPNPVVTLPTKTTNGTGIGSFTSSITGLSPGILYYVRAYATNGSGTGYGNQVSFTTTTSGVGTCQITGLTTTRINNQWNFTFNINPNCPTYTVNVCRYSDANPSIPPTVGQTPVACAIRNNMSNYTPTATEITNGFITRVMNAQPAVRGQWYSVDVTCNSNTCTGSKTTRSAYFYNP